jgi:hypothetical protein
MVKVDKDHEPRFGYLVEELQQRGVHEYEKVYNEEK